MAHTNVNQGDETFTDVKTIGDRTKAAREALGLSQTQLAVAAGVSAGTIGNLEAGSRKSPRKLLSIAAALKVNAVWLESGKGSRDAGEVQRASTPAHPVPPPPPRNFADRREVTEGDWALLQDVLLVMSEQEIEALRSRAERTRRIAQAQLESVSAAAGRVSTGAPNPWLGPKNRRHADIGREPDRRHPGLWDVDTGDDQERSA